jgi:AI-2 transport protein TqsA
MDDQKPESILGSWPPASRVVVAGGSLVLIVLGLRTASGIVNSILLALFIAIGFSPMISKLRSRGWPTGIALTAAMACILIAGVLFLVIVIGSLQNLDQKLPVYEENLASLVTSIDETLLGWGVDVGSIDLGQVIKPDAIISMIGKLLSAVLNSFSSVLLMLMIIAFMLADATGFPAKVAAGARPGSTLPNAMSEFGKDIRSYLFLKGWISLLATIPITILYLALGTDFALLWGVVFFVFSFIPNIGYILSLIPPAFVTLLEFGWERALLLIVINLIINTVIDNFIQPRFMGRGLGLSTLIVFLSLIFWGWVLGPMGALLSVPMTIMVKRLYLERYEETKFIAVLIGQEIQLDRSDDKADPPAAVESAG